MKNHYQNTEDVCAFQQTYKNMDIIQSYSNLCVGSRYGVSQRQQLCWPGEGPGSSGLFGVLPAAVPEPQSQVPPSEAPGVLHLQHPPPGERGSRECLSAAEPWLQVATVCFHKQKINLELLKQILKHFHLSVFLPSSPHVWKKEEKQTLWLSDRTVLSVTVDHVIFSGWGNPFRTY